MLTERTIGALTFRRGVYAEVEADKTFTGSDPGCLLFAGGINE